MLGLFRRKSDRVGLESEIPEALGPNSSAEGRLGSARARLDFELDLLMGDLAMVAEDIHAIAGRANHQRFTEYKRQQDHFRCMSEIRFYWNKTNWPDAAFYIEHPESRRLLPIVRAIADRRCNGLGVVWVSDMANEPMVVTQSTPMYVSDEPEIVGKTIEEVRKRYEPNNQHQDVRVSVATCNGTDQGRR